jgi:hypothetical protein
MGTYCTRASIPRHPAKLGEILEVRRLSPFDRYDVALFGDNQEIACIPHQGCRLELVATVETSHRQVDLLLPGHVLRYRRSFLFGDRLELPNGTKIGLEALVGFKLQLAPTVTAPPPVEERIVDANRSEERDLNRALEPNEHAGHARVRARRLNLARFLRM